METLFWSSMGSIFGAMLTMGGHPNRLRKAFALALLVAGALGGLIYMMFEPL